MQSRSQGRAVNVVTVYGLDAKGWEFKSEYGQEFSPHIIQFGSGAHQTSYPMGTKDKAAGT
jgi:hypothetical protein